VIIKSPKELETLRIGGAALAAIAHELAAMIRPGVNAAELDARAEALIRGAGGDPVFKGYRTAPEDPPYAGSICVSVNEEVVHGIPRAERVFRDGDLVALDIGMRHPARGGLITDMAVSVKVGAASENARRLVSVTREALDRGIAAIRPGMRMGDLGAAIQQVIENAGFGVVRELVGHGVGKELHEDPYVPNYGTPGEGIVLKKGLVIAIEPMATLGKPGVRLAADGWTWVTKDGSLAAHWEHTVVITDTGAEVLTRVV